ncbi:hypothetical protein LA532_13520 [Clostridioides difficile]|nr:hypothetical protein [Clostridioides difficile]HEH6970368.1 hypothetical protein [Clostridioides difficile]
MPEHGAGVVEAKRNGGSDFLKATVAKCITIWSLYDGFFSFAIVRQLFHFSFILTGNPHRNVTDIRHFDKITS